MAFVHLHNHTEYSLLDGMTHVKDMVKRAADLGMPAVAITDHGVMSGVPELCSACEAVKAETGKEVKPIYGCEVYFTTDDTLSKDIKPKLYHMVLLAKNNEGYHNLLKLVSESHVDNFYYKPRTTFKQLQKYGKGIIGTSACVAGIIPRCIDNRKLEEAREWAKKLASCFDPGDFYIELQDQGICTDGGLTQFQLNQELTNIARECGFKTIATNDFHYLVKEDNFSHDVLLCIGTGSQLSDENRMRFPNSEFYMKSEEEMRAALKDFPEACDNTIEVAEKCNVVLERDSILPKFPLPEGETEETWFRKRCEQGLVERYGGDEAHTYEELKQTRPDVVERYNVEAEVILNAGFPAYFLIVQEYIEWARNHGIAVGPGRGSAAGAIVAYAMKITDLDPLSNGLLFERFLNPERVEMPDIDVDFEQGRREEVINHIKEVYGEDHVSQVITFGTIQAKNAVKDAARVMGYPFALGEKITKLIGNEPGITIEEAFEKNPDLEKLYTSEEDVKKVVDAARGIEGHLRGEGVHACATIICRDPMSDHVPMKRDTKGGGIITQYDGHYTPDLGLLKMDFLGLRTLDVLSMSCRNVKKTKGINITPDEIPIDDEKAFELMRGELPWNMDALFQVEGALYVSLFNRMPPRNFSHVVASIALNRPGPLESGMVDDYVQVASGKRSIRYYDDRLRSILEETYGTMVYQEQIMQISMKMCGFSAGKADKLRKAMGKKKLDVMRELQDEWNVGADKNGYSLDIAKQIWSDAEKFAKYAFNKSHSAAYAILVMRTAYMKAHHPYEFMAAVLTSCMNNNDKLIKYIASCNHTGIKILPPDINSSDAEFTPVEEGIRFGLVGVRGVGGNVAQAIIREREQNGRYTSLHDFVDRIPSKDRNKKTLESLIKGGAFDSTGYPRRQLMYFIEETDIIDNANKKQKEKENGTMTLFDFLSEEDVVEEQVPEPDGIEWPKKEKLRYEKEIMKIYVSDHPLSPYAKQIEKMSKWSIVSLLEREKDIRSGVFVGIVSDVSTRITRIGKKMGFFKLEDMTGMIECIIFDFEKYEDALVEDAIVKIKGKFECSDRGKQIIAYEVEVLALEEDEIKPVSDVELEIPSVAFSPERAGMLNRILLQYPGRDKVTLFMMDNNIRAARAKLPLQVDAGNLELKSKINQLFGTVVW